MKAILADDQVTIRRALRLLLEEHSPEWEIGEAADLGSMAGLLDSFNPDLVLLDWELPPGNAPAALPEMHAAHPEVCFIVLSTDPEAAAQALQLGAMAFVSKGDAPEGLAELLGQLCKESPANRPR